MENIIFISQEFSKAIKDYLLTKEQPLSGSLPFFVIVIRSLVFIYGELDIINPYITKNETNLGGFDSNLAKYGLDKESIDDFKINVSLYIKTINEMMKPNKYFIQIEKYLIDMFFQKVLVNGYSLEEVTEFSKYIALCDNKIMLDYVELYMEDKEEISKYFQSKKFLASHNFSLESVNSNVLFMEAYQALGYKENQIKNFDEQELYKVNQEVYQFFGIPDSEEDKNTLLKKAVNYYKKYGNRLTSGSGFIDFLLLLGVIITLLLIAILLVINM